MVRVRVESRVRARARGRKRVTARVRVRVRVWVRHLHEVSTTYVLLPLAIEELGAQVRDEGPGVRAQGVEANVLAAGAEGRLLPQPLVRVAHNRELSVGPCGDATVPVVRVRVRVGVGVRVSVP